MSIFSASRRRLATALTIGGLGFAGALAISTAAPAQTNQGAFARNKIKIEQLATKPGAASERNKIKIEQLATKPSAPTSRVRQGEYPTRPGRPPPTQ